MEMESLVQKYKSKGVLVDTNLLVGWLVGQFDLSHLKNCRATKNFGEKDFQILHRFLLNFGKVITTPHILTEVSNLSGKLPEPLLNSFRVVFGKIIQTLKEEQICAATIGTDPSFFRFGIADTAIALVSPGKYLVLTDELPLYGALGKRNVDAINFNHLRQFAMAID